MTEQAITPPEALLAYHRAVEQVAEAMRLRDEAWAAYQLARGESLRPPPRTSASAPLA